jgi:hypothetical protein
MNMKRFFTTVLLLVVIIAAGTEESFGQEWYTGATYDVSIPAGDLQEFIEDPSWLGFSLTFRKQVDRNVTAGLLFGWQVFSERTGETIQLENGAATGTQDRYVNSFPIMLNAHYYLGERGNIRPYVGLNAGGLIVLRRYAIGIITIDSDSWEWGVTPEIGAVVPLNRDTALLLQGKFTYSFTGEDLAGTDMKIAYYGISVGFAWQQY